MNKNTQIPLNDLKVILQKNPALKTLNAKISTIKGTARLLCNPSPQLEFIYELIYFKLVNKSTEAAIVHLIKSLDIPILLIAPFINTVLGKRLIKQNVQFIDLSGNIFINRPPIQIISLGEKPVSFQKKTLPTSRAFGIAGMKIIFACLCNPGLENKPYRTVANVSTVSLGAVKSVMSALLESGRFFRLTGKNKRLIINKKALLDRWCIAYAERLQHKQLIGRYTTDNNDWWKQIDITKYGAQWGSEVAAYLITKHLKPGIVTLYAADSLAPLRAKYGLREDQNGEIEIRKRFWNFPTNITSNNIVPPLLVYADLMTSNIDRNKETAELIYDKFLSETIA